MAEKRFNPNGPVLNRCTKCGDVFFTAIPKRLVCVKCKPVTKNELEKLTNFEGGHVVQVSGPVSSLVN